MVLAAVVLRSGTDIGDCVQNEVPIAPIDAVHLDVRIVDAQLSSLADEEFE